MKTKLSLTLIILSISISTIHSQISTDRPDQTESSLVLSLGHVQIETGIAIEDSRSNINTLFRIGIIDGIEMRLNSNYLINDDVSILKKSSFSDFEIGAKFRILDKDNNKTKIGFLTHLSIPTAPEIFSYNEYGILIVLGAGFTPFPFKFITIASGVFNLNIFLFIITAIIARGLRFYLLAALLFVFGEKIKVLIDKYFNILAILFFILLIGSVLLVKFI